MIEPVMTRLLSKVVVVGDCWEFTGCQIASGYGRIIWDGRLWLTHRVTYTVCVGPIPDGLELDHLCRNPPCCNPDHLEAVTKSENIRRGTAWHHTAARELAKTHCPAGHPYDDENTYITPKGHRQCRICKRMAIAKYESRPEIREQRLAYQRARRRPAPVPLISPSRELLVI